MTKPEPKLTLIVPSYNEADNLSKLLPIWLEFCLTNNFYLLVVNDGSQDNSNLILNTHKNHSHFQFISYKKNRGYGGAIKAGIRSCKSEYCITMDADGQHRLEDILKILNRMLVGDLDLIVGKRPRKNGSFYRGVGKLIIRKIAKLLLPDLNLQDLNSGLKMYKTAKVKSYIKLCPNNMAFSDVISLLHVKFNSSIEEIDIGIKPRLSGQSTIGLKTAFQTVWEICIIVMMFNPLRIFLPLAFISLSAGIIWTIGFLLAGEGFTTASAILILASFIFISLGLMAEQISLLILKDIEAE